MAKSINHYQYEQTLSNAQSPGRRAPWCRSRSHSSGFSVSCRKAVLMAGPAHEGVAS